MKILIVDDDRSFRKGLKYGLKDLGYLVTEASNGKEALKILSDSSFDLIICDLVMPEIDGLEVFQYVQKHHPGVKFLLLTAFADSERAKAARRLLMQNFVQKSVGYDLLFEKIKHVLKSSL